MMKLSFMISRALVLGALVILPTVASAQDDKQAAFEREWYDACYTKKDNAKCYELSKKLIAEFPKSTYIKNATAVVETKEINDLWLQFKAALDAYYAGAPEVAKLDALFSTGDAFLARKPNYPYIVAQQSLAGTSAGLTEVYKDRAKIKGYVDKAMALFSAANTTDAASMKQEDWVGFKDNVMASGHQFLGWSVIQDKGDAKAAYDHLTQATQVRSTANPVIGWKDPLNYYLRSTLINDEYVANSKEYNALPDDQKTGDAGKAALKKINATVDRLLSEHARVLATATKPEQKSYQDFSKETFNALWKYRTDAPEKAAAFLQAYVADPTIADTVVPAKAESEAPPAGMPTAGAGPVKMTAGTGQMPGAAGGKAATPAKATKAAPKGNKKKR
jgi:hypothetical protein